MKFQENSKLFHLVHYSGIRTDFPTSLRVLIAYYSTVYIGGSERKLFLNEARLNSSIIQICDFPIVKYVLLEKQDIIVCVLKLLIYLVEDNCCKYVTKKIVGLDLL